MQVVGCDFSSSPSRNKPIVVAHGVFDGAAGSVQLQGFTRYENLSAWADWLAQPGAWTGGFDLPFGLPRELVTQLGWPQDWLACMQHYSALARPAIRQPFASSLPPFAQRAQWVASLRTAKPMAQQAPARR